MRPPVLASILVLLLLAAGCTQEKQWLNVGAVRSTEEFRRDYAACTRDGKVDEGCMRERNWVTITSKTEKQQLTPEQQLRPQGRY